MDDTVLGRVHLELRDAELLTVLVERVDLFASYGVSDGLVLVVGLYVVVRHGKDLLGAEHLQSALAQALESLWSSHLVAVETVDIQLSGTVLDNLNDVAVPNLIKQGIHIYNMCYRILLCYFTLNLLMQSIYASTDAVTMSVLAPNP